ncbi:MAG: glycine betaine--corrinoid protein methyltransferase [Deferrisomatales bacterium]
MYDRMPRYSDEELTRLHEASVGILREVGVAFHDPEALELFRRHGKRVDGKVVRLEEADVRAALDAAPDRFRIEARNPEKSVEVGGEGFVCLPGYGAPHVVEPSGDQRPATLADYHTFCKLVHTSPHLDMNGFLLVQPEDVAPEVSHLEMLLANFLWCDKAFLGSPLSRRAARDALEMAGIAWGGEGTLRDRPVMAAIINSLSPLQYSEEMTGALMEMAGAGQPCVVTPAVMAGSTGPVRLGGVLALQNAEALAGLTLAQLVRPGAPVVYGSASGVMDMRTGAFAIGAPELPAIVSATAQMARFYGLPCRTGGSLTDAQIPDLQAGRESALALVTAVRAGVHFVMHAAGILGSYMAMSFEKFLADEELCGVVRKMVQPVDLSPEGLGVEAVLDAGVGGEYLTREETFELCRTEFFLPSLAYRGGYPEWAADGKRSLAERAAGALSARLARYAKPDIDPGVERDLAAYVTRRKGG